MIYLRFGDLPQDGRSEAFPDWPFEIREDGTSVFEAGETAGGYLVRLGHPFQIHDLIRVLKEDRPLYRVEGRMIGRGFSEEPVLADARIAGSVRPGAEVAVSGGGLCSVYLRDLLAKWSEKQKATNERYERMGGTH